MRALLILCVWLAFSPSASAQTCDEAALLATDEDDDGLPDVIERFLGTLPSDEDTDDDGLSDGVEVLGVRSDPRDPDTDNDGLCDGPANIQGVCSSGDGLDEDAGTGDSAPHCPLNGTRPPPTPSVRGSNVFGCAASSGAGAGVWLALALLLRRRFPFRSRSRPS